MKRKIVLVDDDRLEKNNLQADLDSQRFELIAQFFNEQQLYIALEKGLEFDLLLLDLRIPPDDQAGIRIAKHMKQTDKSIKIIALSNFLYEDRITFLRWYPFLDGALHKNSRRTLNATLEIVGEGGAAFSRSANLWLQEQQREPINNVSKCYELSDELYKTLIEICKGLPTEEIARKLNSSKTAISSRKSRIKELMGLDKDAKDITILIKCVQAGDHNVINFLEASAEIKINYK
ncbi:MAG: response regulator [Bacteroidota bacterium]